MKFKAVKNWFKKNKKFVKNVVKVLVVMKAIFEVLDVVLKLCEIFQPLINSGGTSVLPVSRLAPA